MEPPRFTQELADARGVEGTPVGLVCRVTGKPEPSVVFYRNDNVIRESEDFKIVIQGDLCSLLIPEVLVQDEGTYMARAVNPAGEASTSAVLRVEGELRAPTFIKRLDKQMKVKEGRIVMLEVMVDGCPKPKIKWFMDEEPVMSQDYDIIVDGGRHALTIKEVFDEDAGVFKCRAKNSQGEVICTCQLSVDPPSSDEERERAEAPVVQQPTVQPAQPTVQPTVQPVEEPPMEVERVPEPQIIRNMEPPKFVQPIRSIAVVEGKRAEFEGLVTGDPQPEVTWYKDGQDCSQNPDFEIAYIEGQARLVIPEVFDEDAGKYTCKAKNQAGTAASTAELVVKAVTEPPDFTQRLQSQQASEGAEVRLEVRISGVPTPDIKWFREGAEIQSSHDFQIVREGDLAALVIREAFPEDSGKFSVMASNSVGRATSAAHLVISGAGEETVAMEATTTEQQVQITQAQTQAQQMDLGSGYEPGPTEVREAVVSAAAARRAGGAVQYGEQTVSTQQVAVAEEERRRATQTSEQQVTMTEQQTMQASSTTSMQASSMSSVEQASSMIMSSMAAEERTVSQQQEMQVQSSSRQQVSSGVTMTRETREVGAVTQTRMSQEVQMEVEEAQAPPPAPPAEPEAMETGLSQPIFQKALSDITAEEGECVIFECIVLGEPQPHVKWFREGAEIESSPDFTISQEGDVARLVISEVFIDDAGKFTCTALNEAGSRSCYCFLNINAAVGIEVPPPPPPPPKVEEGPHDFVVDSTKGISKPTFTARLMPCKYVEGQTVIFKIPVDGNPRPEISWTFNGIKIESGVRHQISYEMGYAMLSISLLLPEDCGEYAVTANSPSGQATQKARLMTEAEYEMWLVQEEEKAKKAQRISLVTEMEEKFSASETEGEAVVKPSAAGLTRQADINKMITHHPSGIAEARIIESKISMEGYGEYLEAKKSGQSPERGPRSRSRSPRRDTTDPGVKEKHFRPQIVQRPEDLEVIEGQMARFDLKVSGRPPPDIQWFLNGQPVQDDATHKAVVNEGGIRSLLIIPATPDDSGEYTCVAVNRAGKASFTVRLNVVPRVIGERPEFLQRIQNVQVQEGLPAEMRTRIHGVPYPQIAWQKDGYTITERPGLRMTNQDGMVSLIFDITDKEDDGWYTAVAFNSAGTVATRCKLTVVPTFKKAEPPQRLVVAKSKRTAEFKREEVTAISKFGEEAVDEEDLYDKLRKQRPVFKTKINPVNLEGMGRAHFECRLVPIGDPNMKVEWLNNGQPIEAANRLQYVNEFGFVSMDYLVAYPRDTGIISCRATNQHGDAETSSRLVVKDVPGKIEETQLPEGMRGISKLTEYERRLRESTMRTYVDEAEPEFEKAPPEIVMPPEGCRVVEGEQAKFHCRITGHPQPKVRWYLNGTIIRKSKRFRVWYDGIFHFEIPEAKTLYAGEVKVVAENSQGTAETVVPLEVQLKEDYRTILKTPPKTAADPDLRRYHRLKGREELTIKRDRSPGFEMPKLKKVEKVTKEKSEAELASVELQKKFNKRFEPGYYEKLAGMELKGITKEEIKIEAKPLKKREVAVEAAPVRAAPPPEKRPKKEPGMEEPKFTQKLQNQKLKPGEQCRFEAKVTGKPEPRISWFKNGAELQSSDRIQISRDGTTSVLCIPNPDHEDSGTYVCKADNAAGSASCTAFLLVPKVVEVGFTKELADVTAKERDATAVFEADVNQEFAKPRWYKDGQEITMGDKYQQQVMRKCLMLVVRNVTLEDAGQYTCQVEKATTSATLTVTAVTEQSLPLEVKKPLQNMEAMETGAVTFEIQLSQDDLEHQWFHNGVELTNSDRVQIKLHRHVFYRITVKDLAFEDAGEYKFKCRDVTALAQLVVTERPIEVTRSLQSQTVYEQETASFEVEISHEGIEVQWQRKGSVLAPSDRVTIEVRGCVHRLVISNVSQSDAGEYAIVIGEFRQTTQLVVQIRKLEFTRPLQNIKIFEKQTATFEVEINFSGVDVQWLKNGEAIAPSDKYRVLADQKVHKLEIISVTVEDSGEYSFIAMDTKATATLYVDTKHVEFIRKVYEPVRCTPGETATFELEISEEDVEGQWFRNEVTLSTSDKYRFEQVGGVRRLYISNVTLEDQGDYSFVANDAQTSVTLYVEVKYVEFRRKPMETITVKPNEVATFEFEVTDQYKDVDVSWYRNEIRIETSEKYKVERDRCVHRLLIAETEQGDSGEYVFVAGETREVVTLYVEVTVDEETPMPDIQIRSAPQEPIRVDPHDTAVLEIEISEEDFDAQWLRNNLRLEISDKFLIERDRFTHRLLIYDTLPEDAGDYVFVAGETRHVFTIYVETAHVEMQRTIEAFEVVEYQTATLQFEIDEDVSAVQWLHNDKEIYAGIPTLRLISVTLMSPGDKYQMESEKRLHKLSIINITQDDAGNYTLVAGEARYTTTLIVKPEEQERIELEAQREPKVPNKANIFRESDIPAGSESVEKPFGDFLEPPKPASDAEAFLESDISGSEIVERSSDAEAFLESLAEPRQQRAVTREENSSMLVSDRAGPALTEQVLSEDTFLDSLSEMRGKRKENIPTYPPPEPESESFLESLTEPRQIRALVREEESSMHVSGLKELVSEGDTFLESLSGMRDKRKDNIPTSPTPDPGSVSQSEVFLESLAEPKQIRTMAREEECIMLTSSTKISVVSKEVPAEEDSFLTNLTEASEKRKDNIHQFAPSDSLSESDSSLDDVFQENVEDDDKVDDFVVVPEDFEDISDAEEDSTHFGPDQEVDFPFLTWEVQTEQEREEFQQDTEAQTFLAALEEGKNRRLLGWEEGRGASLASLEEARTGYPFTTENKTKHAPQAYETQEQTQSLDESYMEGDKDVFLTSLEGPVEKRELTGASNAGKEEEFLSSLEHPKQQREARIEAGSEEFLSDLQDAKAKRESFQAGNVEKEKISSQEEEFLSSLEDPKQQREARIEAGSDEFLANLQDAKAKRESFQEGYVEEEKISGKEKEFLSSLEDPKQRREVGMGAGNEEFLASLQDPKAKRESFQADNVDEEKISGKVEEFLASLEEPKQKREAAIETGSDEFLASLQDPKAKRESLQAGNIDELQQQRESNIQAESEISSSPSLATHQEESDKGAKKMQKDARPYLSEKPRWRRETQVISLKEESESGESESDSEGGSTEEDDDSENSYDLEEEVDRILENVSDGEMGRGQGSDSDRAVESSLASIEEEDESQESLEDFEGDGEPFVEGTAEERTAFLSDEGSEEEADLEETPEEDLEDVDPFLEGLEKPKEQREQCEFAMWQESDATPQRFGSELEDESEAAALEGSQPDFEEPREEGAEEVQENPETGFEETDPFLASLEDIRMQRLKTLEDQGAFGDNPEKQDPFLKSLEDLRQRRLAALEEENKIFLMGFPEKHLETDVVVQGRTVSFLAPIEEQEELEKVLSSETESSEDTAEETDDRNMGDSDGSEDGEKDEAGCGTVNPFLAELEKPKQDRLATMQTETNPFLTNQGNLEKFVTEEDVFLASLEPPKEQRSTSKQEEHLSGNGEGTAQLEDPFLTSLKGPRDLRQATFMDTANEMSCNKSQDAKDGNPFLLKKDAFLDSLEVPKEQRLARVKEENDVEFLENLEDGKVKRKEAWDKEDEEVKSKQQKTEEQSDSFLETLEEGKQKRQKTFEAAEQEMAAPQFTQTLKSHIVEAGEPIRFQGTVTGHPPPSISWLKNGQPIEQSEKYKFVTDGNCHTLLVIHSAIEDSAEYACVASNDVGMATSSAQLLVEEHGAEEAMEEEVRPPHIVEPIQGTETREGEGAGFTCRIEGTEVDVTWYRNDSPIKPSKYFQLMSEGEYHVLNISEAFPEDAGTYKVVAVNPAGEDQCAADLAVEKVDTEAELVKPAQVSPAFIKDLRNQSTPEGRSARFECRIQGRPDPTVTWYKNGTELKETSDFKMSRLGDVYSLVISECLPEDSGVILCKAANPAGQVQCQAQLIVQVDETLVSQQTTQVVQQAAMAAAPGPKITETVDGPTTAPSFTQTLQGQTAVLGERAKFEAFVNVSPDTKVIWLHNGVEIKADNRHLIQLDRKTGRCVLIITKLEISDSGDYALQVLNALGEAACTAQLLFQEKQIKRQTVEGDGPNFTKMLSGQVVEEGSTARMEVGVGGSPEPTVTWLFNGVEIKADQRRKIIADAKQHIYALVLEKVQPSDQGNYTCKAMNKFGEGGCTGQLFVQPPGQKVKLVQGEAPNFLKMLESKAAEEGSAARLEIVVSGNPEPKVFWYHNGKEIRPDQKRQLQYDQARHLHALVIPKVQSEDDGEYTVKVRNDFGEAACTSSLHVYAPGQQVQLVHGESPNFTQMLESQAVEEGEVAKLQIVTSGSPEPTVTWLFGGVELQGDARRQISVDSRSHLLVIQKVQESDSGEYTARVQNDFGIAACTAQILVYPRGQKVTIVQEGVQNVTGAGQTVQVAQGTAGQAVQVVQGKAGMEGLSQSIISAGQRVQAAAGGDQTVQVIRGQTVHSGQGSMLDGGQVTMVQGGQVTMVQGGQGTVVQGGQGAMVEGDAANFAQMLESQAVEEGEVAKLQIVTSGTPEPTVTWLFGGVELQADARRQISVNSATRSHLLVIQKVQESDSGEYTARVENDFGIAECTAQILVYPRGQKVTIVQEGVQNVTGAGQTVQVAQGKAGMEGLSQSIISAGQRVQAARGMQQNTGQGMVVQGGGQGTMLVQGGGKGTTVQGGQVTMVQGGQGMMVQGGQGTTVIQGTSQQIVETGTMKGEPPNFGKMPDSQAIEEGGTAKFETIVTGSPEPEVAWLHNGQELKPDGRRQISVDSANHHHVLVIQTLTKADAGKYTARVGNQFGEAACTAELHVVAPGQKVKMVKGESPNFASMLESQAAEDGSTARFEVVVTGNPEPTVIWQYNGQELEQDQRREVICNKAKGQHVLLIESVQQSDSGDYTARVRNDFGEAACTAQLLVYPPGQKVKLVTGESPNFAKFPSSAAVADGDPARFDAVVTGSPPPNVTWLHMGTEIKSDQRRKVVFDQSKNTASIVITQVQPSDGGDYTCQLNNDYGQAACTAQLLVKASHITEKEDNGAAPEILRPCRNILTMEGHTVYFQCKVAGIPLPKVTWYKDDVEVKECGNVTFEESCVDDRTVLVTMVIMNVRLGDHGCYTCHAVNASGETVCQAYLDVQGAKR
ncbi:OBSCN [Branchiostoma lanceolatum]|uniref:OBSCN protein n=1 Tax=Branchiostoma lanceolatum TaxID=7740 RepID=A0A8K0EFM7_BRALA|nr:OBSCN [Branchiostoma lanceolatum]